MNIKIGGQSRAARYGIALGGLLYTMWRGLVALLVWKDFDPRRVRGWRSSH
jgi:hypothetical protein